MVYIINFLGVILYFIIIRICFPQNYNKLFAVTVCVHAVLFKALADPFNFVDTNSYVPGFKAITQLSWRQILTGDSQFVDWGYGFVLLNRLVGLFTKNPYMMALFQGDSYILYVAFAFVGIPPVIWFYYKTSSALLCSVLMFLVYPMLYKMGFGVVRQHLSIAYLLPALYFIDKPRRSLIFALIAISLHTSSALFLFYYVWRYVYDRINSREMKILLVFGVAVLLRVLFTTIALLFSRYASYADTVGNNNFSPVLLLGLFVYFAFLNHHFLMLNKQDEEIFNFMCFGLAMALGSIGLPLGRFTLMFIYVLCSAFTIFKKYSSGSMLKYSVWMMAFVAITLWQLKDANYDDYILWILK